MLILSFRRSGVVCASMAGLAMCGAATAGAHQEFQPPSGRGRLVVVASGLSGSAHYTTVSKEIAAMGYDVVLFDGSAMENTHGDAVKAAITQAQGMPHALPGKVAVVGFSAGGGESLYYATQWPDTVTGVIVWYPATSFIRNILGFAERLQVPVVMFAGEKDHYRDGCCTAETARAIEAAAKAANKPLTLTTYPGAEHDWVKDGQHYNAAAYADALQKTGDGLKQMLGQ